jgi:hypothetical protein
VAAKRTRSGAASAAAAAVVALLALLGSLLPVVVEGKKHIIVSTPSAATIWYSNSTDIDSLLTKYRQTVSS